jgi:CoA:oxalate CoA-transferase
MGSMLSDITVVDLTNNLAGPFCTMILADMGANVIKVEVPPHGDDTRTGGPFVNGESTYFISVNRGKKGMTLNLKTEEGKVILQRLIEKGDVFIQSFRPGVIDRLGFSYDEVSKINPRIISASISGFGQYGPYKEKGAYDVVVQGYGGSMSITGNAGGEPVRVGYSIGDLSTSMFTAIAILGALHVREQTGKGQHLDISMLDCQVALLENALARYMSTGEIPKPLGSRHPVLAPFQAYMASDGYFILATPNEKLFKTFCEVLGLGGLAEDPRFLSNALRVENLEALNGILNEVFIHKPKQHWIDLLEKVGIPTGPVNNVKEVAECPQVQAREMIVEVEHPIAGKVRVAGTPIKASLTPCAVQGPSPLLGQNTDKLLDWLGYSQEEVTSFKQRGIV